MNKKYIKQVIKIYSDNIQEWFVLNDNLYMIIRQNQKNNESDQYAVKVHDPMNDMIDDGIWLTYPQGRYETVGGARLAILMNAADDNGL